MLVSRLAQVVLVCIVLVALSLAAPLASHAQTSGQNLLTDGGFEALTWRAQGGIGELVIAPGWRAWYAEASQVQAYVKQPSNCDTSDPACYWMRPEFNAAEAADFPNRVHSGLKAQKYFSYRRMHEAGLYQQVVGIQPGATLRFSIYMQAWQCTEPENCGENGVRSDTPAEMHLRVGIDPFGGTDPFSASIIWSPEKPAFDQWSQFSVQAQAKGTAVTVFTHSRAEWDWPRTNNDVYLDDASLTVAGEPTAGPTGTPAPTFTPMNTPTPRADGAVVHVVGPSDTLYGIALQYGVPYDDLLQLNKLSRTSILEIGQVLVVKAAPGTATPTPAPSATATQTRTPAPTATLTASPTPLPPTSTPTAAPSAAPTSRPGATWPILIAVVLVVVSVAAIATRRRRQKGD